MGRSEVILDYSSFSPSLSFTALLAITQQHILKKFVWAAKDTGTDPLFFRLLPVVQS